MSKWVYSFSAERAEGRGEMRNLLGGKGCDLPRWPAWASGPARLHHHHRGLSAVLSTPTARPTRPISRPRCWTTRRWLEGRPRRRKFGDVDQPAAGVGALGRPRLDAGHDGHGPQPRPQRPDRSRAWPRRPATPASPTTATAASSRCTRTWCWRSTTTTSRRSSRTTRTTGPQARHRADRRRLEGGDRRRTRHVVKQKLGKPFPQDPQEQLWGAIGAVFDSWMNQRAITYRRLNEHPRPTGAPRSTSRPWCSATWARLRHRRAFTRDPSTGENGSTASSWSTPRARTWWPASARRSTSPHRPRHRPHRPRRRDAGGFARARVHRQRLEQHYTRHAGHGVHHRARQAVHAPDPDREADGAQAARAGSRSTWSTRA